MSDEPFIVVSEPVISLVETATSYVVSIEGPADSHVTVTGYPSFETVEIDRDVVVISSAAPVDVVEVADIFYVGSGGGQQVFVSDTAPTVDAGTDYLWIQTGLAPAGTGFTFWFDG